MYNVGFMSTNSCRNVEAASKVKTLADSVIPNLFRDLIYCALGY